MARKMKLNLPTLGGGALVILLIAMVLLNPSEKKHRDAIYNVTRQRAEARYGPAGAIGTTVLKAVDAFKAVPYEYHNYFVFSKITLGDDRVTFGVLGYVHVNEKLAKQDQ